MDLKEAEDPFNAGPSVSCWSGLGVLAALAMWRLTAEVRSMNHLIIWSFGHLVIGRSSFDDLVIWHLVIGDWPVLPIASMTKCLNDHISMN